MEGADRNTFILENMGLVGKVTQEFKNRIYNSSSIDMDDLFQIGTIGLIKACDRFDPEQGIKFSGYAITSIRWEIQMFLRDKLDGVKVGGNTVYNYLNILQSNLINESPGVISAITGLTIPSVESALAYHRCKYMDSLERPISNDDGDTTFLGELIGYEVDFDENLEMYRLQGALKGLNKRTQEILELRLQDLSQREIGDLLGLSQSYIARIIKRAKEKLEKGGFKVKENKERDYKLAKKLAIETDLNGYEIADKSGVSAVTAYKYIKDYRASEERIEEVKKKIEEEEPPVKTYTLSPEELAKYKSDGQEEVIREAKTPNYILAKKLAEETKLNSTAISEKSGISESTAQDYINYYRLPKKKDEEPVKETISIHNVTDEPIEKTTVSYTKIEDRLDIPEEVINKPNLNPADGYMTMTFKLTVEDATSQLEDIISAMKVLGFKDLNLTIQSQQVA